MSIRYTNVARIPVEICPWSRSRQKIDQTQKRCNCCQKWTSECQQISPARMQTSSSCDRTLTKQQIRTSIWSTIWTC